MACFQAGYLHDWTHETEYVAIIFAVHFLQPYPDDVKISGKSTAS